MQSTELMLDVTKATGLDEKVEIAATLHLPDKLPEGPVQLLLAIHGGGYRRSYWDPGYAGPEYSFARWFTQRGKAVVAIDMLGMGDSSRPEPESKLTHAMIAAAHADALAQVVARFDREVSVTGVGHSMGGMMVIAQAGAHNSMDRVAVLGWANEPMILGSTSVEELRAAIPESGYLPTPREKMRKLFYWPDVPMDLVEADEAAASTTPVTMSRASLTPGIVHEAAAKISVPVVVIQSVLDTSPEPEKELGYFSASPDVELQMLEDAAHCQNFAGTREKHWADLNAWIDRTR